MKYRLEILAATIAAFSAAARAAPPPSTAEMFGANPTVAEAVISPSGRYFATLQTKGAMRAVVISDLDDNKAAPVVVGLGDIKGRTLEWASDDALLHLVSQNSQIDTEAGLKTFEFWRWVGVSRTSGKSRIFFGNEPGYYVGDAGDLVAITPDKVFFSRIEVTASGGGGPSRLGGGGSRISLFSANHDGTGEKLFEPGNGATESFVVSPEGAPIARIDYEAAKARRTVYSRAGGTWKPVATYDDAPGERSVSFHGVSPTPGKLYATGFDSGDRRALFEFDLETGALGSPVFADPRYDIEAIAEDPRRATSSAVLYSDDMPRARQLDPAMEKTQTALAGALSGATPVIVSSSANGSRMIVKALYSDHPPQYFLYDKAAKRLDMIAASYSALDGKIFAAKEKFDVTASDGLKIPGYLAVPAGASKKNMPLIVLPHGGPEGRDDQSFDWWSFFYAARGYLVYQPNFRGSDGYGAKFREAGYGEWGRKMQSDITDGVKKLIADGVVDPSRICIVGGSYGGYAALAGATLTPDLYKCAVSVNGVSNLLGMLGQASRSSEIAAGYWETRIGSRFRDEAALEAVSPAKIADKAGAPILLIHSRDDIVVQMGQSRQMETALKAAKKPVEFVQLNGEDHWLSRGETRTKMLQASIDFIDKYIGAKN